MKLKFEPTKIEDGKVYFPFEKGFRTKIFASNLGTLLGLNQYQSKAYGVLKNMAMLEKDYFDSFYTVRGAVAEYYAYLHMSIVYEKYGLKDYKWSFTHDVKFDAYPENKWFGGKTDFKLENETLKIIHEVKSKDIEKFNDYQEDETEVIQGKLYCVLENTKKLVMVYVFPNQKVIDLLKAWLDNKFNKVEDFNPRNLKDVTIDDFKFIVKNHTVDIDDMKKKLNEAYTTVNECVKNGYIPVSWFNAKEMQTLNILPF